MEASISVAKTILSVENSVISDEFRTLCMALDKFKNLMIHEDSELEKRYKEAKEELEKEHSYEVETISQKQEEAKRTASVAKANILHSFDNVEDDEDMMNGNKLLTNVIVNSYNCGMKKIQKYTSVAKVLSQRKLDELHLWYMEDTFGCEGYYSDEFFVLKRLRVNFCNSMVFSIHTTIRKHLVRICTSLIIPETSETTNYVDIGNVEGAVPYIKTYGRVSFDEQDETFLRELKEIRNLIAEEGGDLSNKTTDEKVKIRNMSLNVPIEQFEVHDSETNELKKIDKCIDLNPEFIESCLQRSESILCKVIGQVIENLEDAAVSANS